MRPRPPAGAFAIGRDDLLARERASRNVKNNDASLTEPIKTASH
jgi:hypothetical protein